VLPRASGPFFMFSAPGLVFGVTEGVESLFHVFRSRTCFRRYRGSQVPFSCFPFPNSFSAVPRASGLVFTFCTPGLVFGGTGGIKSHFHVFRSRTCFRRYRGRLVPFLCFALPEQFSAVPRASGPVFMFCAPVLIFDGTEGVGSRFHVLRSRTRFRRYRGRWVLFSCFALPYSFSTVPRASGLVFMFCAPVLVFGGTECVGSRFNVFRSRTCFRRYRGSRVPFSYFSLPNSLSAVPWASGPIFMFCAPGLVFGGTDGVKSLCHLFRSRTCFGRYRGRRVPFLCFALPD
jgi:hypothetical protein